MPIYEYACSKCGKQYEIFQRITDAAETKCKFCNGKVQKLISSTAFHLKGNGWYVTDYSGKTGNNASQKESEQTEDTSTSEKSVAEASVSDIAPESSKKNSGEQNNKKAQNRDSLAQKE